MFVKTEFKKGSEAIWSPQGTFYTLSNIAQTAMAQHLQKLILLEPTFSRINPLHAIIERVYKKEVPLTLRETFRPRGMDARQVPSYSNSVYDGEKNYIHGIVFGTGTDSSDEYLLQEAYTQSSVRNTAHMRILVLQARVFSLMHIPPLEPQKSNSPLQTLLELEFPEVYLRMYSKILSEKKEEIKEKK